MRGASNTPAAVTKQTEPYCLDKELLNHVITLSNVLSDAVQ